MTNGTRQNESRSPGRSQSGEADLRTITPAPKPQQSELFPADPPKSNTEATVPAPKPRTDWKAINRRRREQKRKANCEAQKRHKLEKKARGICEECGCHRAADHGKRCGPHAITRTLRSRCGTILKRRGLPRLASWLELFEVKDELEAFAMIEETAPDGFTWEAYKAGRYQLNHVRRLSEWPLQTVEQQQDAFSVPRNVEITTTEENHKKDLRRILGKPRMFSRDGKKVVGYIRAIGDALGFDGAGLSVVARGKAPTFKGFKFICEVNTPEIHQALIESGVIFGRGAKKALLGKGAS